MVISRNGVPHMMKACDQLFTYAETNTFLRGSKPWLLDATQK